MSLKCREIRSKLSDKLDDRLDWGQLASVQAHLRDCQECQDFARECELLIDWLRDVPKVPAPNVLPGVIAGLAARRDPPRPTGGIRWRRDFIGLLVAAVLLGAGWILAANLGGPAEADPPASPVEPGEVGGEGPRAAVAVPEHRATSDSQSTESPVARRSVGDSLAEPSKPELPVTAVVGDEVSPGR